VTGSKLGDRLADGGTLYLEEITAPPVYAQRPARSPAGCTTGSANSMPGRRTCA
jgi:hypothetical protein